MALDVTDDASVAAAVQTIGAAGGLDVLINNAGISGARQAVPDTTADDVAAVYATNVFGVVRVTQAFLPLLEASESPVIVNVSSGMGSLALTTDPDRVEHTFVGLAYPSSKTAVTMLTSSTPARCPACASTPPTPATPPPTSTATAARRPSPRAPTRSSRSPSSARTARPGRSRTASARCRGEAGRYRPAGWRAT